MVAGKILTKAGIFVLLAKFWKFIAFGVVAIVAGIWKFFKGNQEEKQEEKQEQDKTPQA